MTLFSETLATMKADGAGAWAVDPDDSWRQGRTLFGGLSAALCYAACEAYTSGLPPLRSAQIAYLGPSAGVSSLRPTLIRQGKSVSFMACDQMCGDVLATRALFVFGAERPSAYAAHGPDAPDVKRPEECPPLFPPGFGPTFAGHIDQRQAGQYRPMQGADVGELLVWVRHKDRAPGTSLAALVALGDALPPASMPRLTAPAPISTITWQFDLADPEKVSTDGWFLIHARDEAVGHGYAGQAMTMWDEQGRIVLTGRQLVAIFG